MQIKVSKETKQSQKDKFKQTAKELGCDEKKDLTKILEKITKPKNQNNELQLQSL